MEERLSNLEQIVIKLQNQIQITNTKQLKE